MFQFSILDSTVSAVLEHEDGGGVKLGDLKIQDVLKQEEGLKGKRTKIDQNQARSRSRKNQIVQFPISEGSIFIDKVESK
jgi:hypothetical protein